MLLFDCEVCPEMKTHSRKMFQPNWETSNITVIAVTDYWVDANKFRCCLCMCVSQRVRIIDLSFEYGYGRDNIDSFCFFLTMFQSLFLLCKFVIFWLPWNYQHTQKNLLSSWISTISCWKREFLRKFDWKIYKCNCERSNQHNHSVSLTPTRL